MKSPLIFALAMLPLAVPAIPAAAQDQVTSIVRTADLDLASQADRQLLDLRIQQAAREVCGTASDVDLEGKNAARQCRKQVIAEAEVKRDQVLAAKSGEAITVVAAR